MTTLRFFTRVGGGSALLAFLVGGAHSAWEIARRSHVLEFQAGPDSPWSERAVAIAQSAAIEGVGFGALGLALALVAFLWTRIVPGKATNARAVAALVVAASAFFGWVSVAWIADDLLPFLTTGELVLLNAVGIGGLALGLAVLVGIVRLLPWTPRDAPVAVALGSVVAAAVGAGVAQAIVLAESGGWRSPGRLAMAGGAFLVVLFLAPLVARLLGGVVRWTGERLEAGPLVPRAVTFVAWVLLGVCAVVGATRFDLSATVSELEYTAASQEGAAHDGPNVVMVTIDTLRADHLGCYGYDRPTSPFLDSIAEAGTRFADPVAPAAWTKPSTGTILTGLYPSRHGALYHGSTLRLPEGERTLAEGFQDAGYVTAGFVSNPNIKKVFDFDRGFDVFFDSPVEDTLTLACIRGTYFGRMLMDLLRHQFNWKYENDVLSMNRHVLAWLRENGDRRFFLYVHYIDPHIPYDPPAEYRKDFDRDHGFVISNKRKELVGKDRYDAEIRYTDDGVRELVDGLKEAGAWDDTVFIVTSDHGEEFFEHGVLGHGFSLHREVVGVPLIFHGPGIPAGRVVEGFVPILDLAATTLDAAGLDVETFGDGKSFSAAFADPAWKPDETILLENEFGQDSSNDRAFVFNGIQNDDLKLVVVQHDAFKPPQNPAYGRNRLYDLRKDPGETTNVFDVEGYQAATDELLRRLEEHAEEMKNTGFREIAPAVLDPAIQEQLNALGYGAGAED